MSVKFKKYLAIVICRLAKFSEDDQEFFLIGQVGVCAVLALFAMILQFSAYHTEYTLFTAFLYGMWLGARILFLSLSIHYGGWEAYHGICRLISWAQNQKL